MAWLLAAPFELPVSIALLTGAAAGGVGAGVGMSSKRDAFLSDPRIAIIMFNTTGSNTLPYHNMKMRAAMAADDDSARFEHAAGETEGLLTGYPSVGENGIMQGGLNFVVPGLESTPITGTWIAVDEGIADDETRAAFGMLQKMIETEPKEVTLEDLLAVAKERVAKAS